MGGLGPAARAAPRCRRITLRKLSYLASIPIVHRSITIGIINRRLSLTLAVPSVARRVSHGGEFATVCLFCCGGVSFHSVAA